VEPAITPLGEFTPLVAVPEGIMLDAGAHVHVSVVFHLTQAGSASAEYRFNSNAGDGYVYVRFRGTGSSSGGRSWMSKGGGGVRAVVACASCDSGLKSKRTRIKTQSATFL
jgi:hypothetical protein